MKAKICSINIWKKKKKNQKTTGQQMAFKKIAFCKHQNFFFLSYLSH